MFILVEGIRRDNFHWVIIQIVCALQKQIFQIFLSFQPDAIILYFWIVKKIYFNLFYSPYFIYFLFFKIKIEKGEVFVCGCGDSGRLGLGDRSNRNIATKLELKEKLKFFHNTSNIFLVLFFFYLLFIFLCFIYFLN